MPGAVSPVAMDLCSVVGDVLGCALVRHVLRLALSQRDQVGCVGVVTDAKPAAVGFYEPLGFTPLAGVGEGLLHGDPAPMFLDIATIAAAAVAAR